MNFYEIHITVSDANPDDFKKTCAEIGVKPIILDVFLKTSSVEEMMTSSVVKRDSLESALVDANEIKNSLVSKGFTVIRTKIESDINHANIADGTIINSDNDDEYFETHLNVFVKPEDNFDMLYELAKKHDCHLSTNKNKLYPDGSYKIMITHRKYQCNVDTFEKIVTEISNDVEKAGFKVDKIITEYCLYDSNISVDSAWINSKL
jgi:hypothetical protein